MQKKNLLILMLALFISQFVYADNTLFFLEVQTLGGYSFKDNEPIYHSFSAKDPMQKNSIGFDLIKKAASSTKDLFTIALQTRLAYNDDEKNFQFQLYNAYIKAKTGFADIWAGHNRISFGLESYWDTHGTLIQSLPMFGFGYDRDWGVGVSKDTEDGNISFAFSSASGMALEFYGNYLLSSRISKGVLNYDNYSAGLSFMAGKTLHTMAWDIMDKQPNEILLAAADFAYNQNNIEHKLQIDAGKKNKEDAFAVLYRLGLNFLEENKLKLEGQYVFAQEEHSKEHFLDIGISYVINSDITARVMFERQSEVSDNKMVVQLYYYFLV
jgi:hypothetical protein